MGGGGIKICLVYFGDVGLSILKKLAQLICVGANTATIEMYDGQKRLAGIINLSKCLAFWDRIYYCEAFSRAVEPGLENNGLVICLTLCRSLR